MNEQKDSAAEQRCVKCKHNNVGLSGYCIKNLPDAYGDFRYGPLCGCKCSFSEAAASESAKTDRSSQATHGDPTLAPEG